MRHCGKGEVFMGKPCIPQKGHSDNVKNLVLGLRLLSFEIHGNNVNHTDYRSI